MASRADQANGVSKLGRTDKVMEEREIPPVLYRVNEAAEALRLSRSVLYELIRSGRLRTVKIGRRRLVPVDALAECVARLEDDAA